MVVNSPVLISMSHRKYVDACKIVKGLESKFGYFVTKAAEAPKAPQTETVTEDVKVTDKAKKERSAWEVEVIMLGCACGNVSVEESLRDA